MNTGHDLGLDGKTLMWYYMGEHQGYSYTMKLFGTAVAGIMIATSLLPAYAGDDDDRRNQSNNTNTVNNTNSNSFTNNNANTNTNTNSNANTNSNSNNVAANGGTSTSSSTANGGTSTSTANGGTGGTASQKQSNSVGAITNNLVNQGTVYYPDWINVSPSQSSVSMSSASCQGPTLNGTAQTLETDPWNNDYGVQGSIGISIPLGGQKDCYAIQSSIRKRALFENAANTAMMCSQLEKMNVKFDDARFPELSSCLAPVVSSVK